MENMEYLESKTNTFLQSIASEGIDHLLASEACLAQDTSGYQQEILGILHPDSEQQILTLVLLANTHQQKLFPVSCGNNWGYGACFPPTANCWIVHLAKLNAITEYDPELGTIGIEPGVTFGDLYEFLKLKGSQFINPAHEAGPNTSVLGNALERGFGMTPHADHILAAQSIRVVLGSGDIYESHFSCLDQQSLDIAHKWGIGPYIDGLFAQSNFGITTKMHIKLRRRPERIAGYVIKISDDQTLEEIIDAFRVLLQDFQGPLAPIKLMEQQQLLASLADSSIDLEKLEDPKIISKLAKEFNVTKWTIVGGVYGSKSVTKSLEGEIASICKNAGLKVSFFDSGTQSKLNLLASLPTRLGGKKFGHLARRITSLLDLLSGMPIEAALRMPLRTITQAEHPNSSGIDPAALGCGLIWYVPLLSFTGRNLTEALALITSICSKHNILPLQTVSSVSETCLAATVPILFKREDKKSLSDAWNCYDELLEELGALAYLPYRLPANKMGVLTNNNTSFTQASSKIKSALDPNNVISPGRYVE